MKSIKVIGAKGHNLKNVTVELPKDKMVVVTGLSGSGKSSLAFDTIYAEGQRRYVESMSAYARQFLELMEKPDVEHIEGLSPAISIEQRNPSKNPRSTVATVTEIYDYLRLLFARVGHRFCPECGREVQSWSVQGIAQDILKKFDGKTVYILSPVIRGRAGTYEELFAKFKKEGYVKARVNGTVISLDQTPALERYKKHTIELVTDEIYVEEFDRERLVESLEAALKYAKGLVHVLETEGEKPLDFTYSESNACAHCGIGFSELEPRLFSFNSPYGACPECNGLGLKIEVAEDLVVPDPALSINEGAIAAWDNPVTTRTHRWKNSWSGYYYDILKQVCRQNKINMNTPWNKLPKAQRDLILYGASGASYTSLISGGEQDFEGVITNLKRRYQESESDFVKEEVYTRFMREVTCPTCKGMRLKPEALAVRVDGKNIHDITAMQVSAAKAFFNAIQLSEKEQIIAKDVLKEIRARLDFLNSVGLSYLTLERKSQTLSGGEAQRIHLATQIGSGLTGVLYVLDEPTIGLHSRDNDRLIETLKNLRDLDNTLIIVEHDKDTILASDYVVELGPAAGEHGGQIVAAEPTADFLRDEKSLTASYLNGRRMILPREELRKGNGKYLEIIGAKQFNLKNIDVKFPLGKFICVTGVSGSGKSTLIHQILYKDLAQKFYGAKDAPGKHKEIKGLANIDKVIIVDQSPIGKTPRSNPATYTGVFSHIRDLFAEMPEAKRRGYKPGRFSFNVKGGRCEKCQGDGILKIQMQFLPDIYVKCEECDGKRFNEDTLQVKFKGKNIAEVLEMSVSQALEFFDSIPKIKRYLKTLNDVGLGYIKLGQAATTLSGGEAQRVKLADELSRKGTGKTLYILDEPTTGLHFADIDKLLHVLHGLADKGNTVLIIEHNLDVIKTADWLIDLGPEGGDKGGTIVAAGTPRQVAACKASYTGRYLKPELDAVDEFLQKHPEQKLHAPKAAAVKKAAPAAKPKAPSKTKKKTVKTKKAL
ncbi:excinuclease ABC subunit UvrA [Candidatus Avelusimicrobium alvi]|uniref:excinuclease ABC subunit UvrA n=1 Tax=Candidatus Avelusimicrobium alvi TaxID=3416221 RepID=UPI003D10EF5F